MQLYGFQQQLSAVQSWLPSSKEQVGVWPASLR